MKLKEIVERLGFEVKTGAAFLDAEVTGGYASDLLSDVLANSQEGNIWVTLQTHQNIVAIASIKELAGIVLVNNRQPTEETISKATEEDMPIVISSLPAFELIGRLYEMGISGLDE
ncbi:serine kinase [Candidatus Poribacteria bacterium]